jgi:outer membrane protein
MKKNYLVIVIGAVLSCILVASSAMAAEKIGFVNFREIAMTSNVGKKFLEGIKKEAGKADTKAKEKQSELIKLRDEINNQRSVVKPEILREKQSTLEKKARDFELMMKDIKDDFMKKEQDFLAKIEPTAIKIIREIGEKEKYTMILEPSYLMLPYHDRTHDITKQVLAEFNRTYKEK